MLSVKCMLQFVGNDSSNTLQACSGNFSLTESGSKKDYEYPLWFILNPCVSFTEALNAYTSHFSSAPHGSRKYFYSRFCMLFKLMASVDVLCSIAEVVGIKTPVTPSAIKAELNPTINR